MIFVLQEPILPGILSDIPNFREKNKKNRENKNHDFITFPITKALVKKWRESIDYSRRAFKRKKIILWARTSYLCWKTMKFYDFHWFSWFYEQKLDQNHWFPYTNTTEISLLSLTCEEILLTYNWNQKKIKYAWKSWGRDLSISGEFFVFPAHFNSICWAQRWGFSGFSVLATWATLLLERR